MKMSLMTEIDSDWTHCPVNVLTNICSVEMSGPEKSAFRKSTTKCDHTRWGRLWWERNKSPSTSTQRSHTSGGADPEGLCGQRRLGDLPLLRGSRAGHPDRPAAPASLLASVLPPRAERGRVHRPRAPRVRERGPRQQPRPQQVPAPGRFYTLNNDDSKKKKKLVRSLLREAEMKHTVPLK